MAKNETTLAKKKKFATFDIVNTTLVVFITLLFTYPLYWVIIASFSDPLQVSSGNTLFFIKDFTLEMYQQILDQSEIWVGYRNSIIYTILGTLYNLVLTIPAAYVLSKKYLPGRNFLSWYFFLTMYIGGGLIPSYLLIRDLGLLDNPLVLIIGAGVSAYNLIVTRSFYSSSIPEDIYEASYIDGASEWATFTKIAMPLSKPIIAVMALYYGVGRWNDYFTALIYITQQKYYPLQMVLRNILFKFAKITIPDNASMDVIMELVRKQELANGMKYGVMILASIPLLVAYPFVQKHFTKGVMIGSVKG